MPALGEGEVKEESSENEDPLPKKLQDSVVRAIMVNIVQIEHCWGLLSDHYSFPFAERNTDLRSGCVHDGFSFNFCCYCQYCLLVFKGELFLTLKY